MRGGVIRTILLVCALAAMGLRVVLPSSPARAYGLLAIDTALPSDLRDIDLARRYAESSRRMGFQASSTFYAPHIDAINAVFSPGEQDLVEAREIVAEYEKVRAAGRAAYVRPDGKWITLHQYRIACNLLSQYG